MRACYHRNMRNNTWLVTDTETGGTTTDFSLLTMFMGVIRKHWKTGDWEIVETINHCGESDYDRPKNYRAQLEMSLKPEDELYRLSPTAMSINGIDIVEHDKRAFSYSYGKTKLEEFLKDVSGDTYCKEANTSIRKWGKPQKFNIVGWNIDFDRKFINHYLMDEDKWSEYFHYSVLDVKSVFMNALRENKLPNYHKDSFKLTDIAQYFDIPVDGAHNAKFDSELTIKVLNKLNNL